MEIAYTQKAADQLARLPREIQIRIKNKLAFYKAYKDL